MKLNRAIFTILLLFIGTVISLATTWIAVRPYVQRTEEGRIETHSIPYEPNRGPFGQGETIVYADGKPLYHINEYFSVPFYTANEGAYLIAYNFACNLYQHEYYDGDAVKIYKNGSLQCLIKHSELEIVQRSLKPWEAYLDQEVWNYQNHKSEKDPLKVKMAEHPAFVENGKLFLIASDTQLIGVDIASGKITERSQAYETLKKRLKWIPEKVHKEYNGRQYPSGLPLLKNGKTFEEGLALYIGKEVGNKSETNFTVYVSLLLNVNGKCETIDCSPYNTTNSVENMDFDQDLQVKIEDWTRKIHFQNTTIPPDFEKFCYSGILYFK